MLKLAFLFMSIASVFSQNSTERTGCDLLEPAAVQVERNSDNPDFCIFCPKTNLGAIGIPKIALCTVKSSTNDIITDNNIDISGVGGETIIVQGRRLLASSIEQVVVSDVFCTGDTVSLVGLKCFYGDIYARNIDPIVTDTSGRTFSIEEINDGIVINSDTNFAKILPAVLFCLCLQAVMLV